MKAPGTPEGGMPSPKPPEIPDQPPEPKPAPAPSQPSPDMEATISRLSALEAARKIAAEEYIQKVGSPDKVDPDELNRILKQTEDDFAAANAPEEKSLPGSGQNQDQSPPETAGATAAKPEELNPPEKNAEITWDEINNAFSTNPDPIEGSAVYQVRQALEDGMWDQSTTAVDTYLTAQGVTTITDQMRTDETNRRGRIKDTLKPVKDALDAEDKAAKAIDDWAEKKAPAKDPEQRAKEKDQIKNDPKNAEEIKNIQNEIYIVNPIAGEYTIDPNGRNEKASITTASEVIVNEALTDIANDKSDPKRQEAAKRNQQILKKTLNEDGSFKPITKEALLAKERQEQREAVINAGANFVDKSLFDENGNLNVDRIKELTGEEFAEVGNLGNISYWLGRYQELKNRQPIPREEDLTTLATAIYSKLKKYDPNSVTPEMDSTFSKNATDVLNTINNNYLVGVPAEYKPQTLDEALDVLLIGSVCENHLVKTTEHGRVEVKLPESITAAMNESGIVPRLQHTLEYTMQNEDRRCSLAMENVLKANPASLREKDPQKRSEALVNNTVNMLFETAEDRGANQKYFIEETVDGLATQKEKPDLRKSIQELLGFIFSKEYLKKLADPKNWNALKAIGGISVLLALVAPGFVNITGDENDK